MTVQWQNWNRGRKRKLRYEWVEIKDCDVCIIRKACPEGISYEDIIMVIASMETA